MSYDVYRANETDVAPLNRYYVLQSSDLLTRYQNVHSNFIIVPLNRLSKQ